MAVFAVGGRFDALLVKISKNGLQIRVLDPKNPPWAEFHWNLSNF